MPEPLRAIVIGPQFGGEDGISELGRQVIRALAIDPSIHVLARSLHDRTAPALRGVPYEFTSARGSRARLGSMIVGDAARISTSDLVIVLHSHFLPITLPLIVRGVSLTSILVGIEVWRPLTRLERVALSHAAHVVAISAHTRERFLAANPSATSQSIVVCHPAAPDAGQSAAGLVPPGFALTVGRMSRDERYKGHDSLLEAWPRVLANHAAAQLVIVGDGDDLPRLQEKARGLGLDGAVTFLGHVERSRLNGLYADAAFFVMPSRDEGFGFVYLEAMQAGTPCLACDGSASELFDHRRAGEIVSFGNVDEIASTCIRLFANPADCTQRGRTASEIVQQRFLPAHFVTRFREALGLPHLAETPPSSQAFA